jgi:hypothetical protein
MSEDAWVSIDQWAAYRTPKLPNFIQVSYPTGTREYVDVKDIPEEFLRKIGQEYIEALVRHAKKRKAL